jgi:hypothetical protein
MTQLTAISSNSDRTSQTHSSLTLTPKNVRTQPETLINTQRTWTPSRESVNTTDRSDRSSMMSSKGHAGPPSISRYAEAAEALSPIEHDSGLSRATHSTGSRSRSRPDPDPVHEKVALDEAIDAAPGHVDQFEEAFQQSHEHFKRLLMQLRSQDLGWRNCLYPLINSNIQDRKGFNIIHVASYIDEESLARDLVELALQRRPEMISELNLFRH